MMKRSLAVMAALAVVMSGICARLFWLSRSELREVSQGQSTRRESIAVARGTIYDRYLQPLVNSSQEIVVSAAPFPSSKALLERTLTGRDRQAVCEALEKGERARITPDTWLPPCIGITQVSAPVRYDEESLACHVIGYVDETDHGVTGIEKCFDEVLSSFSGEASVSYQIDALGRTSMDSPHCLDNTLSRSKGGVVLTLDEQIQSLTQAAAESYLQRGAVLVSDAASGEVLACVSLPLYDQNDVEAALSDPSSPLLDRTRTNYNLGSVFKIVVAAAALENGISPQTSITCNGSVTVDGIQFHCHNALGDGKQTMMQAMANSCNCYFIELARQVGASAVYDMAQRAGFCEALTITDGMQTACGVLPSRRDLSADAALANLSIGQGDLLATPYHVSVLLQAVANSGIAVKPSLLYGTVDEQGVTTAVPRASQRVRLFSAETATVLQAMLCAVVREGTGFAATPESGDAAGKTGTAETGWEIDGQEVVQSWFSGFYPAAEPQYVITVLSENGGANGKTAAPLFAQIADALSQSGLAENAQDLY